MDGYTCTFVLTHVHVYVYVCVMDILTCTHVHVYVYVCVMDRWMDGWMDVHVYTCTYTCTCTCMCTHTPTLQLSSKYLDRKRPEFLNMDVERLLESRLPAESKKSSSGHDDIEEVEQLQGGL